MDNQEVYLKAKQMMIFKSHTGTYTFFFSSTAYQVTVRRLEITAYLKMKSS